MVQPQLLSCGRRVCVRGDMLALSAVHVGRYQLHIRSTAGQGNGSGDPGLHQITKEALWGLPSQSQPADVPVTPVEEAGHRARHPG
jgi:hypothetical protein